MREFHRAWDSNGVERVGIAPVRELAETEADSMYECPPPLQQSQACLPLLLPAATDMRPGLCIGIWLM